MKRLGRSDLKLPDVKAPAFLADVYWDLYDRRLLPLVALIVAAIVAVPLLLGGSSEKAPPVSSAAKASLEREMASSSAITVVRAEPGLRDYHERLAGRTPTDPFKEKFGKPSVKGAQMGESGTGGSSGAPTIPVGGEESTGGEGSAGSPASTPPSSGDTGGGSGSGGSGGKGGGSTGGNGTAKNPQVTYFTYTVNVRISRSGGKDASSAKKQEPVVKHRVLPQTPLPGEKAPVVTYLGLGRKGKKATGKVLMLVSDKVRSVFGESKCVSGDDVCQLLEVEPGFPVTFVYGANEVHYTVNVLKIELVVTGHSSASDRPRQTSNVSRAHPGGQRFSK